MSMLCFHLLPYADKATALCVAVRAVKAGRALDTVVHAVDSLEDGETVHNTFFDRTFREGS